MSYPPGPPGYPPYDINAQLSALHQQIHALQQSANRQMALEQQIHGLMQTIKRKAEFPEQFTPGVIAYPDRYPFAMVLNQELLTADGTAYGITNAITRALISVDVDNPTFLSRISFDLVKTEQDDETGIGIVGAWAPLSMTRHPFVTGGGGATDQTYTGRDFRWRIQTVSDDRLWQVGWHSSASADGAHRRGYELPIVYELRRNDVVTIEAEPIGPVVAGDEWQLFVNLHIYKMLLKQ